MLLIALMRLLEAGSWRLIASALAMQEVLARNFDAATVKEREDLVRVNQNVESELTKLGLVFHRTDPEAFRAAVSSSGYYRKWKATLGPQAWTLLEKYAGPLV